MEQDLLEIINNYGVLNQLEYYQTEVWELDNAIQEYENFNDYLPKDASSIEVDGNVFTIPKYAKHLRKHIAEELADNFVMLYQFNEYYKLGIKIIKVEEYVEVGNILEFSKHLVRHIHKLGKEIIEYECRNNEYYYSDEDRGDMELFMKDKLLIVLYKLKNIQAYYGITDEEIEEVMRFKIDRQKKRMEEEK